jgi:hypothetical protein
MSQIFYGSIRKLIRIIYIPVGALIVFSKKQYQWKSSINVSGSCGHLFPTLIWFFFRTGYVALNDGMTENKQTPARHLSGCHNIYALFQGFFIHLFLTLATNKELALPIGPPARYAIFHCMLDAKLFLQLHFVLHKQPSLFYVLCSRCSTVSSASVCISQKAHPAVCFMRSMLNFLILSAYPTGD